LLSLDTAVALPDLPTDVPPTLTFVNNTIFFQAHPTGPGNQVDTELWKTDGTVLGTTLLKDINRSALVTGGSLIHLGSSPQNLTGVGNTLFFTALDGTPGTGTGTELWKSDGTSEGTVLVRDIVAGLDSSDPANLTAVNGKLFFTANDGANGVELWVSDGTEAGTTLVRNIDSRPGASSNPANLVNVGGKLFFTASDGVNGTELWASDG